MKKLQLRCADCGAEIFQRNNKRAPTFCEACVKTHKATQRLVRDRKNAVKVNQYHRDYYQKHYAAGIQEEE